MDDLQVMQIPFAGLSTRPIFEQWEQPVYAHFLASFTGLPIEKITAEDRTKVMQWSTDPSGKPLSIPLKPLTAAQ
jgi:hypothetical protein